ncbi:short-chain dehydrogenase [Kineobactrum sediminis]|uniref:Short-chain dehydrogenase n=1 Tax=Kineobactrum sediminis TaxID=1905677 RepID=A0A2N5Y3P6_9GAMM|nr:SDR family oxidoreductase [Kineobactrum sediminis]PLW82998.1 short-chain dehydrogenase [Kineobactrum sediminis]
MTGKRTALVTGASAGLGAEFARQLAAMGYNLVLVARREDKLQALAKSLQDTYSNDVLIVPADLATAAAPQALYDTVQQQGINIDFLVNNAGIAGPDLLTDRDWAEQQAFFQLMMLAVAELCHLFIPGMRERGFGRVINIASVAGRIPRVGGCNYGPSKAYLIALSEDLAVTLHGSGVNVCALCPGYTHTDFHSTAGLQDMKNGTPGFIWYDAEVVVREGIRAVEKGKPVYLSGRLYRWLDPLFQSLITRRLFRIPARRQ